jgi:competence protein ComEC
VLAIAALIAMLARRMSLPSATANAAFIIALGFSVAQYRATTVVAPVLHKPMRGEITGVVTKAEAKIPHGQRLTIRVAQLASLTTAEMPTFVRVRTQGDKPVVRTGDVIAAKVMLSPPSPPALPGGFDYARMAWFQQIGGVGFAVSGVNVNGRAEPSAVLDHAAVFMDGVRDTINRNIRAALPDETGAIATALITGERGEISNETNDAFKHSGLFHILSISGLHMVVMAGAAFYATRLLLAFLPGAALVLPIKKMAAVVGIAGALGYLVLSGGAFATARAALMINIMFVAILCDRPALALRNVAISALLILAVYPESLLDAGFQMSFAAVTGLVAAYEELRRRRQINREPGPLRRVAGFFGGVIASTLIASVTVAPFAIYHFHQTQQYAVIANLVAIPICNLIVMPAALLALVAMPFGLEAWPLWPLGKGIEAITWVAEQVGKLPGAVQTIPAIPLLSFALFVFGGLWVMLWQARWRLIGVAIIAAAAVLAPTAPSPDLIVGKNAEVVAVRGVDGQLNVLNGGESKFEVERWLQTDGDERQWDDLKGKAARGFVCDSAGCVAERKGLQIAVPSHPSAYGDDCAQADIVIFSSAQPAGCRRPRLLIDVYDVWDRGNHAVYLTPNPDGAANMADIRVETANGVRGVRPWSPLRERSMAAKATE